MTHEYPVTMSHVYYVHGLRRIDGYCSLQPEIQLRAVERWHSTAVERESVPRVDMKLKDMIMLRQNRVRSRVVAREGSQLYRSAPSSVLARGHEHYGKVHVNAAHTATGCSRPGKTQVVRDRDRYIERLD